MSASLNWLAALLTTIGRTGIALCLRPSRRSQLICRLHRVFVLLGNPQPYQDHLSVPVVSLCPATTCMVDKITPEAVRRASLRPLSEFLGKYRHWRGTTATYPTWVLVEILNLVNCKGISWLTWGISGLNVWLSGSSKRSRSLQIKSNSILHSTVWSSLMLFFRRPYSTMVLGRTVISLWSCLRNQKHRNVCFIVITYNHQYSSIIF